MADITIINAKAFLKGKFQLCNLAVSDGKIRGIFPARPAGGKVLDAKGRYVLPGLIDIHTHGGKGIDFSTASAAEMFQARDFFLSQGVTTFYPTIMADSPEKMAQAATEIGKAKTMMGCTQMGGIHLEGPFLSMEFRGCMDAAHLTVCDEKLVRHLNAVSRGQVKLITLAPEVAGAENLIRKLSPEGFRFSLGHSGADYETAVRCIRAGAVSATHTFNAMKTFRHHDPGIVAAVLESEGYCEAICDGKHLHPAVIRLMLMTKGLNRVIAVTDSTMAAGMPDGRYHLNGSEVELKNGDVLSVDSGVRAGSCLTALQGLKNVMQFTGLPLEDVAPLFTENPARMMGISANKGLIDVGKDADLIVLDENMQLCSVLCGGEVMFSEKG